MPIVAPSVMLYRSPEPFPVDTVRVDLESLMREPTLGARVYLDSPDRYFDFQVLVPGQRLHEWKFQDRLLIKLVVVEPGANVVLHNALVAAGDQTSRQIYTLVAAEGVDWGELSDAEVVRQVFLKPRSDGTTKAAMLADFLGAERSTRERRRRAGFSPRAIVMEAAKGFQGPELSIIIDKFLNMERASFRPWPRGELVLPARQAAVLGAWVAFLREELRNVQQRPWKIKGAKPEAYKALLALAEAAEKQLLGQLLDAGARFPRYEFGFSDFKGNSEAFNASGAVFSLGGLGKIQTNYGTFVDEEILRREAERERLARLQVLPRTQAKPTKLAQESLGSLQRDGASVYQYVRFDLAGTVAATAGAAAYWADRETYTVTSVPSGATAAGIFCGPIQPGYYGFIQISGGVLNMPVAASPAPARSTKLLPVKTKRPILMDDMASALDELDTVALRKLREGAIAGMFGEARIAYWMDRQTRELARFTAAPSPRQAKPAKFAKPRLLPVGVKRPRFPSV